MVGQCLREAKKNVARGRRNKSVEIVNQLFILVGAWCGEEDTNFFHDCASRKTMLPDLGVPQATHTGHGMGAVKITNLCTQLLASRVQ